MSKFWGDVGETLFGTKSKKKASKAQSKALKSQQAGIKDAKAQFGTAAQESKDANALALSNANAGYDKSMGQIDALGAEAGARAAQYGKAQDESMGANATEFMQKANTAAQGQATQSATVGTMQATREALKAARSSGLNKGQSALAAAQQAGNSYTNQFQGGLESGRNQYQNNAAAFGNQANISQQAQAGAVGQGANMTQGRAAMESGIAAQQSNAALSAAAGQANAVNGLSSGMAAGGANLANQAQNTTNATIGAAGQVAGAVAMSDERAKEDIAPSNSLRDLLKQIKPVDFNYKDGMGADDGQRRTGVIAQDLEGTPLESAVVENEDGMKMIDSAELSPAVLNLVLQLAQEVENMRGKK